MNKSRLVRVSENNPCPHCQKSDWCYSIGELSVCARGNEPATGWIKTNKCDENGDYYYAHEPEPKIVSEQGKTVYTYCDRNGNKLVEIHRIDDGLGNKKISQKHFDGSCCHNHLKNLSAKDVPIYRYNDVRNAIDRDEDIYLVEGEKCAEALYKMGYTATTSKSGLKPWLDEHTMDLHGAKRIILVPDRDEVGVNKMKAIAAKLIDANLVTAWVYTPPSVFFWHHLPKDGGNDIADWIAMGATASDISEAITSEPIPIACEDSNKTESVKKTEDNFTQIAYEALYGDTNYISIDDKLYRWDGRCYQRVSAFGERKRIAYWCKNTPIAKRGGGYKYSLANTTKVEEIYKWAILLNMVDPNEINPSGINCLNGVIDITWLGNKPSYKLLPNDPKRYYTYVANFTYNPNADRSMCDRLLAALDIDEREIFLRTIAASLDLKKIRSFNSSGIKALLLQGTGSNGKDSLWQAVSVILGESMTQISFSEFQDYDKGNKFNVARLAGSSICWASENSSYVSLDNVEILKQAITGEPITIEEKHKQAYLVEPRAVLLFNVNRAPLINAGLEAIKRRYAVLEFKKTFTRDADTEQGELEADSRFRYDRAFIETEIAPALLNYLLEALERLASEGIDYHPCDRSLEKIKQDSNHLWEFVEYAGISLQNDGRIYLKDLWDKLYNWYVDTGIVEVNGDRVTWNEPLRKGDSYVKAINQLAGKMQDLFPNVTKEKCATRAFKNQIYLSGITFVRGKARVRQFSHTGQGLEQMKGDFEEKIFVETLKKSFLSLQESQKLDFALWIKNNLPETFLETFMAKLPYPALPIADPPPARVRGHSIALPIALPRTKALQLSRRRKKLAWLECYKNDYKIGNCPKSN